VAQEKILEISENLKSDFATKARAKVSGAHGYPPATAVSPRDHLILAASNVRDGSKAEALNVSKTSPLCPPKADVATRPADFAFGPILLQNSLKDQLRGDSIMLMRIGGAGHDGAEQPGPGTAVLFV
jgi:hypothetical protein